jgi:hypothetical protein
MDGASRSYYQLLHVQPDAPVEVIRSSYRTIMQRLRVHPDLGGDPEAARLLNEAWAVLGDPARRAAYDRELADRSRPGPQSPAGPPPARAAPEPSATGLYRSLGTCLVCKAPLPPLQRLLPETTCDGCGMPLFPASRLPAGADARTLPRLPRQHQARLYTAWPRDAGLVVETRDLSPIGVALLAAAAVAPGLIGQIEGEVFRAVVRITNVRREGGDGRYRLGAEFLTVLFPRPRGAFVSTRA